MFRRSPDFMICTYAAHCGLVIRVAIALVLISCGQSPRQSIPEIKPSNTEQACARAVACGAFMPEQHESCVACLDHIDPSAREQIEKLYPSLPPFEQVDCETILDVARRFTSLGRCVVARWYGR